MEKVELYNYRCFEHLSLEFKENVNLLIGDNSSGKTTIIHALSNVLNSFFTGFSDDNTRFVGLSKEDFRIIESESIVENEYPIRIEFNTDAVNATLELRSSKGRTLQRPLNPMFEYSKDKYNNLFSEGKQAIPLPLFSNFSTSDIHSVRKINQEKFKKYEQKPSFGYYECLQGDGFLNYWTKRLLVLSEASKGELEIEGVKAAIVNALGANGCNVITDMHIRPNQGKVYYILTDGREVETENLSDGLRRLVNIVLDISFRAMLLNKGFYGINACLETVGTVLIDEIDLHLHPTLQSTVVNGLLRAFPRLQFIITSHAPMIMTGIRQDDKNKIYQLNYEIEGGYNAKEISSYGLDASTIIEVILGVIPRSQKVDSELNKLFSAIDNEDFKQANEKLIQLRKEFGDRLPELSKAETLLTFYKDNK